MNEYKESEYEGRGCLAATFLIIFFLLFVIAMGVFALILKTYGLWL